MSIELRAVRPIAVDEEITINYVDVHEPAAARQKMLSESLGFTCTCVICTLPPDQLKASDLRRTEIIEFSAKAKISDFGRWVTNTDLPENLLLAPAERHWEQIQQEGLQHHMRRPLEIFTMCYSALGDKKNAAKYGYLLGRYEVLKTGDESIVANYTLDAQMKQVTWAARKNETMYHLGLEAQTKLMKTFQNLDNLYSRN